MPRVSDAIERSAAESAVDKKKQLTMRVLAVLDMAVEDIVRRDPLPALRKAFDKDPVSFLERIAKLASPPEVEKSSNINNLFLLAAKQAASQPQLPALPIIDAEAVDIGVQSGYKDEQPIDW